MTLGFCLDEGSWNVVWGSPGVLAFVLMAQKQRWCSCWGLILNQAVTSNQTSHRSLLCHALTMKKENSFHLRMYSMELWKLLIVLFLPWVHIFLISCADDIRSTRKALRTILKHNGCLKEKQFCYYLDWPLFCRTPFLLEKNEKLWLFGLRYLADISSKSKIVSLSLWGKITDSTCCLNFRVKVIILEDLYLHR